MKKFLTLCAVMSVCILTACSTTQTFGFHVETGDDINVSLQQKGGDYGLSMATDKSSCYVTKDDEPVYQTSFLFKDVLLNQLDNITILSEGKINGNDFFSYQGDGNKTCYFIDIADGATIIQILNSGHFSDDVVLDALKHTYFYIGSKVPSSNFSENKLTTDNSGESSDSEESVVEDNEVNTEVQGGSSISLDNTYGHVGDTISYKVGSDVPAGSYSVFVVDGDDCSVTLTYANTELDPEVVQHDSLTRGMFLVMNDGDTLTVSNGSVVLK